jgi:hypothetical protein
MSLELSAEVRFSIDVGPIRGVRFALVNRRCSSTHRYMAQPANPCRQRRVRVPVAEWDGSVENARRREFSPWLADRPKSDARWHR